MEEPPSVADWAVEKVATGASLVPVTVMVKDAVSLAPLLSVIE
jgi:hypothetical protein